MGKFLLINYSLKIKKIFQEVEPKIKGLVFSSLSKESVDKILIFVYPYAERAFQEGVTYGNFVSGRRAKHELTGRDKKKLFEKYIPAITTANKIYKLKVDNLTEEGSSKQIMFFNEYVAAVTKATNRLTIDAGAVGLKKAVRK